MQVGSEEHKQLFCRSFIETHRPYEPREMPWPALDDVSLARLRAIPVWSMALDIEISAGSMLEGYAKTEPDPLVRQALALQGFEESRHGRILAEMVSRYGLHRQGEWAEQRADDDRAFGELRLRRMRRLVRRFRHLPIGARRAESCPFLDVAIRHACSKKKRAISSSSSTGSPGIAIDAAAADRSCKRSRRCSNTAGRSLGGPRAAVKWPAGGGAGDDGAINLFDDVMKGLTPAKFLRACIDENDRYMRGLDPLLAPARYSDAREGGALRSSRSIERLRAIPQPRRSTRIGKNARERRIHLQGDVSVNISGLLRLIVAASVMSVLAACTGAEVTPTPASGSLATVPATFARSVAPASARKKTLYVTDAFGGSKFHRRRVFLRLSDGTVAGPATAAA